MKTFGKWAVTKLMIAIAALAVMCVCAPEVQAQANNVGSVAVLSAGTITNQTTRTSGLGSGVVIDKQTAAGLMVRFQGAGASTANVVVRLARTMDGTNYETDPPSTLSFTNALNATTAVIGVHQISRDVLQSVHSIKLLSVTNAATNNATNVTITIVKKAGF